MISERRAHKYCRDDISKIENYDKAIADTTQTWHLHHRLELTLDGEFALTREQLEMHDMYYHRPYYELILLTREEHTRIHRKGKQQSAEWIAKRCAALKGKHHTEETRRKMSAALKGENNPFYGKHHSVESRRKLSEAAKRRWASIKK